MKKTLFSLTLMALAAIPTFAQSKPARPAEGKCEKAALCEQRDKKCDKKCDRKGNRPDSCVKACAQARQAALFEGIQLTDAQKEKVEALNAKVRQERQAARDEFKKGKDEARKAAKDLSADERKAAKKAGQEARKEDMKARAELAKAAKAQYLAEMKTILTPDQYVKYLENSYTANVGGQRPDGVKMKAKGNLNGKRGDRKGQRDNDRVKKDK